MSTAEDVFYLYERNSRYYHDCRLQNNIENCSDCWSNECYCTLRQTVLPFTIGDQETPCEYKVKCYIRPGDECPICFEKIINKSSAFITNCGHNFHKKCIFKFMETLWLTTQYTSTARCPMCRCSLGHPDFIQRYKNSYLNSSYNNNNHLDKLEDFWLAIDYRLPSFCSNGYNHYLGMKNNCFCCKAYREKGEFIYEIS
jgi:Ring finger domain